MGLDDDGKEGDSVCAVFQNLFGRIRDLHVDSSIRDLSSRVDQTEMLSQQQSANSVTLLRAWPKIVNHES